MRLSKGKLGSVIGGVTLVGVLAAGMICTEKVPAGYVGVQYSMSGGVSDELLPQGWHIVSPTKKVSLYSVATEQLYLSADNKEDESFEVVTKDGTLNVDFEMSYSFDADEVTDLYTKYRGLSGEEVVNTKIRGKIKTYVNEVTSQFTVLEAHMEKKAELNKELTSHLKEKLKEFGVVVESATLSRTRPSAEVEQAIIKRTTTAQELEAEKQKQEKAILEQETKRIEAETKAIENQKISESITPEMLQKMWIEKWDGKLPTVSGSDSIVNLGDINK